MDNRELRRFARRRLRELGLEPPLDLGRLAEAVGRERRTTVHLVPCSELPPGSAYGVTGGDDVNDVVLYEARTTPSHQTLIVLHELAHLLLRHPRTAVVHHSGEPACGTGLISAAAVAEALGRPALADPPAGTGPFDDAMEWEAETLATILMGWMPDGDAVPHRTGPRDLFDAALGDRGAW